MPGQKMGAALYLWPGDRSSHLPLARDRSYKKIFLNERMFCASTEMVSLVVSK